MREVIIKLTLMSICLILFAWFSYECGKHATDRYYVQHPCNQSLWPAGPNVQLIPPIKVRTAAPVASVGEIR